MSWNPKSDTIRKFGHPNTIMLIVESKAHPIDVSFVGFFVSAIINYVFSVVDKYIVLYTVKKQFIFKD